MTQSYFSPEAELTPREARELIIRLQEREPSPAEYSAPRTIEELARQTGLSRRQLRRTLVQMRRRPLPLWPFFVASLLVLSITFQMTRTYPGTPQPRLYDVQRVRSYSVDGLVPASSAPFSFGPVMAGPNPPDLAELSFIPSVPLPPGTLINVEYDGIVWGAVGPFMNPAPQGVDARAVKNALVELLLHVRQRAYQRGIPGSASGNQMSVKASLVVQHSSTGFTLSVPGVHGPAEDEMARLTAESASTAVDSILQSVPSVQPKG